MSDEKSETREVCLYVRRVCMRWIKIKQRARKFCHPFDSTQGLFIVSLVSMLLLELIDSGGIN